MSGLDLSKPFVPLSIAVLTVSDTRDLSEDKSGALLQERICRGPATSSPLARS